MNYHKVFISASLIFFGSFITAYCGSDEKVAAPVESSDIVENQTEIQSRDFFESANNCILFNFNFPECIDCHRVGNEDAEMTIMFRENLPSETDSDNMENSSGQKKCNRGKFVFPLTELSSAAICVIQPQVQLFKVLNLKAAKE